MNKCIFLDRDGVINKEKDYLYKIDDFKWIEGSKEAIKIFNDMGFKVVIITNQSGIGRGYYTEDDFHKLTDHMKIELKNINAKLDEVYFCPHHKEAGIGEYQKTCPNRKPGIGFFEKARKKFDIDYGSSYMVGDKLTDLEACIRLGINPIFVLTGHGKKEKDKIYFNVKIYNNLYDFAKALIKKHM